MKEDHMCFHSVPLAHGTNALKAVHKVFCCTFRTPGNTEIPSLQCFSLLLLLLPKMQHSNPTYHYIHKEISSMYQFLKSLFNTQDLGLMLPCQSATFISGVF